VDLVEKVLNLSGTLSGRSVLASATSGLFPLASASVLPCQQLCLSRENCPASDGKEKVYRPIP